MRKLSRADAIKAVAQLGTPYVNIKSFHLPYETTAEERAAARAELVSAGPRIVDDDPKSRFSRFKIEMTSGGIFR